MSSIVFILGAGASKEAGAPLMSDFIDKARELHSLGQVDGREEDFKRVFQAISELQRAHSKSNLDISNIEAIFTAFEMAKLLNINDSLFNEELIASLKIIISITIKKTLQFPLFNQKLSAPKPYGAFSNLIEKLQQIKPKQTISILTFNYDTAIDYCLYEKNINFNYFLQDSGNGIPLLKLHGSLNWFYCSNKFCNKITSYNMEYFMKNLASSPFAFINEERLEFNVNPYNHTECNSIIQTISPFIVPPTSNKSEYHASLPSVWKQAAKELQEAETIIVSGYSLPETDAFFRYLYSLSTISDKILKHFFLYDPDPEGLVKKRFEDILGVAVKPRFYAKKMRFSEAISNLAAEFGIRL